MAHKKRGLAEGFPLIDGGDQVINLVGRQGASDRPLQLVVTVDEDPATVAFALQLCKQRLTSPGGQIQHARGAIR